MPDFGDGSAREDYGARDQYAHSMSPEELAKYNAKRHRDALFGILATLGGATGLGALGMIGGAGGAMASVPGAVGAQAAPLGVGSVTAGGLGLPSGIGAAAGAGGGALNHAMNGAANAAGGIGGMSAKDIMALVLGLGGTVGGALAPKPNMSPNTMTQDPNLQRLMGTMQGRLDKSEPLYDSIMSMANGLLPTQYQKGGGGMG